MTTAGCRNVPIRHVISINDLSDDEIAAVFGLADQYLSKLRDEDAPYRIARSTTVASNFILASLFYEPSTRTRLSFESAMLRLGGQVITSADPATSSWAKGETLADTVRVIGNYADIIVLRHNRDGAARLAAEFSSVPVVNGGDGSHEHPTQTLCDIYTLTRKNKELKGLNVAISGDLKGSRTIHSFVYALARFGANILLMPAKGMELPPHVDSRLREEFGCRPVPKASFDTHDASIDALYLTPDEPHQLSLISDFNVSLHVKGNKITKVDAMYVTRFQKERWEETTDTYPKIDAQFLRARKYKETSVLHPLPRVGELDASLDVDKRAMYFQQAAYGVPVRMALLAVLLGLGDEKSLATFEGGFPSAKHALYEQPLDSGIQCGNNNCIVHDEQEKAYAKNKFNIISGLDSCKLRCFYCESDIEDFVIANRKTHHFTNSTAEAIKIVRECGGDVLFFANAAEAEERGYRLYSNTSSRRRKHPPAA
jgi:aspartate carbamoyltransferase catalytic subunit